MFFRIPYLLETIEELTLLGLGPSSSPALRRGSITDLLQIWYLTCPIPREGVSQMPPNEPWHNPGKWYVSPYNFAEEAVSKFNLPPGREVVFRDPSFSDEPQGVRYTLQDKIEIAHKFDEA